MPHQQHRPTRAKSISHRLLDVPLGFEPEKVLTAQLTLPQARYPEKSQRAAFVARALEQLGGAPEVESAAVVSRLPLNFGRSTRSVEVQGQMGLLNVAENRIWGCTAGQIVDKQIEEMAEMLLEIAEPPPLADLRFAVGLVARGDLGPSLADEGEFDGAGCSS